MLRVVIADDHPLFRASLVRALKHHPGIHLEAEAADGQDALERIRTLKPDVAVLDLRMPELDGVAILATVQRERLTTKVVLLGGALEADDVGRARRYGASAVLSKSVDANGIVDAILAVGRGETVLSPDVEVLAHEDDAVARPLLSVRELEILTLMADGHSGPAIARTLFLSPSTVKTHIEKLYAKLGVSDRGAAVAEGMRKGLVS